MATIEVSSSVEYYYDEQGNDNVKISKKIKDVKKQTRYTTKFVYIYDESKFNYEEMGFTINSIEVRCCIIKYKIKQNRTLSVKRRPQK